MTPRIPIKINIDDKAKSFYPKGLPEYATEGSSGFDLRISGFDFSKQDNFTFGFDTPAEYLLETAETLLIKKESMGGEIPQDKDLVFIENENFIIKGLCHLSQYEDLKQALKEFQENFQIPNTAECTKEAKDLELMQGLAKLILGFKDWKISELKLKPQGRILIKTGIKIELPKLYKVAGTRESNKSFLTHEFYYFNQEEINEWHINNEIENYDQARYLQELQIRPRSGLAVSKGLTVLNTPGTVDNDYRGELMICLYNSDNTYDIPLTLGDKVAQGVICPVIQAHFIEENLNFSGRGEKGFGSTGIN